MIGSVLIANRGEIASRIIRTARRLGIRTVAVHSEADGALPFVREADASVFIGAAPSRASYLVAARILRAARDTGAEAIHPGYGFLSENAEFAEAVEAAGLVWIGAPAAAMRVMGRKDAAKRLMREAGVPVTPGSIDEDQSPARLRAQAEAIGWPVLIKAVAGGGGKGMRRVDRAEDFDEALDACEREAKASFGDGRVLLETWIADPRHVEVQVFGDTHGNLVHLFERDCSLQRRHQKVIEEAPAPGMDDATRASVCATAVRAARAVSYVGAGTIEFIADATDGLRADRVWFMEMNTRLQVEHPVTEAVTGQDLVEWQFRVASGERLPLGQDALRIEGCAMEARLYAENPRTGFLPSTGRLEHLRLPSGVRVDAGVEQGSDVSPFYDPMIAKLVAHAPTRAEAASRLAAACASVEAWPVRTNAAFLARALADPDFVAGSVDTGFLERASRLLPPAEPPPAALAAAARALMPQAGDDPWTALPGLRINAEPDLSVAVAVDGVVRVLQAGPDAGAACLRTVGSVRVLFAEGDAWTIGVPRAGRSAVAARAEGALAAPMPGQVIIVAVAPGQQVRRGQKLVVLEAMKMQIALPAPFDGVVASLEVAVGDQVAEGATLVRMEEPG